MSAADVWLVCRHPRGGLHVWLLRDVCKMNLQRLVRGERMEEAWQPVAPFECEADARAREVELRRELRGLREEGVKAEEIERG